jgi:NAD(P)-dependent dehydrogenase (short-subunit alcohol dehydrogenase family)
MKTAAVTGATSGIGFAVCRALAQLGYGIIGVGHDADKCRSMAERLSEEYPDNPVIYFCGDLSKQSEVTRLGEEIKEYINDKCFGRLDALINNAGCVRSYYTTTEDGYETVFAVNHLAGFLLTYILMPCLINAGGRVLMTSSASHKKMRVRWKDVMFRRGYNPLSVYKQSKLCNLLFVYGLNERYGRLGVRAYGIDPGLVKTDIGLKNTSGLVTLVWKLRQKKGVIPEIPAKTYAYVCAESKPHDSLYYYNCRERKYSGQVNKQNADRLWKLSNQLCGVEFNA